MSLDTSELPSAVVGAINEIADLEKGMIDPGSGEDTGADSAPTLAPEPMDTESQAGEPEKKADDEDTWRRRYEALKGKYDRDVPTLHSAIKELKAQVDQLQSAPKEQAGTEDTTGFDPKDFEDYGEPFQKLASAVRTLTDENKALKAKLSGVEASTGESLQERFWADLNAKVADWSDINNDPAFLAWLDQADPVYGIPRQAALNNAQKMGLEKGTAAWVAAIFNQFKAAHGNGNENKANVIPLERQIAPGNNAGAGKIPAGKRVFTRATVDKFYSDLQRGKYNGREAEADAIEREIFVAEREGRISP